jgi:hypothetical protein
MTDLSFKMYQRPHSPTEMRWWVEDARGVRRPATAEEAEMHLLIEQLKQKLERKKTPA